MFAVCPMFRAVLGSLCSTLSFWPVVLGSWLWSSVLGKPLISEFFFFFLQRVPPGSIWGLGTGRACIRTAVQDYGTGQ